MCVSYVELSPVEKAQSGMETRRPFLPHCSPAISFWLASCCQRDGPPLSSVHAVLRSGGEVNCLLAGNDVGQRREVRDGSACEETIFCR